MNIINSVLLRFVLLPSGLFRKMGINTEQLKVILNAKLIMDDRRPNTFQQVQTKKSNRPINFATLGTMFLALIMGLVFLISFMIGETYETKLTFYFSFYIVVLASILIADFTSVLIDIRDNYIILPRPVNDKTFVVSRLLHIFIHVCKLVIPMITPAVIYLTGNKGILSVIPFLFVTLMATLFTIFLINACYILILKITTPSRFQTIISYMQIIFAVVFFAGYQLLPQLMSDVFLSHYELSSYTGIMLLPSYWFASAWQQLYNWDNTLRLWICLLLTIMVPLLSIWFVIRYFAPSFNRKLSMITGGTGETTAKKSFIKSPSSAYSNILCRLFTKGEVERMSFLFTWKMMIRSRNFKMKVYPMIGYMIVVIALMLIRNKTSIFKEVNSQTQQGIFNSLMIIYISNILLFAALAQITMSEKYKAAWVFFTTPVAKPGHLISGSVKAATAQFFFPIAAAILILFTLLAGPVMIPNVLLGMVNMLLITVLMTYVNVSKLPFSEPQQTGSGSSSVLRVFPIMMLGAALAFIHYFLYHIIIVVSILAVLSLIATWYVFGAIRNLSWAKIYSRYSAE